MLLCVQRKSHLIVDIKHLNCKRFSSFDMFCNMDGGARSLADLSTDDKIRERDFHLRFVERMLQTNVERSVTSGQSWYHGGVACIK